MFNVLTCLSYEALLLHEKAPQPFAKGGGLFILFPQVLPGLSSHLIGFDQPDAAAEHQHTGDAAKADRMERIAQPAEMVEE